MGATFNLPGPRLLGFRYATILADTKMMEGALGPFQATEAFLGTLAGTGKTGTARLYAGPMEARCRTYSKGAAVPARPGGLGSAKLVQHGPAPAPGCACGFYAFKSLAHLYDQTYNHGRLAIVTLAVLSWGRLYRAEFGHRSQFQQIVGIAFSDQSANSRALAITTSPALQAQAQQIAHDYKIELFWGPTRADALDQLQRYALAIPGIVHQDEIPESYVHAIPDQPSIHVPAPPPATVHQLPGPSPLPSGSAGVGLVSISSTGPIKKRAARKGPGLPGSGPPCACGCGVPTRGGDFLPGHDMKLKSKLRKMARLTNSNRDERQAAKDALKARGWG